jgi:hypothetical protein
MGSVVECHPLEFLHEEGGYNQNTHSHAVGLFLELASKTEI